MNKTFLLLPIIFLIASCGSNVVDNAVSESEIDSRFQVCYFKDDLAQKRCDSVLLSFFGEQNVASIQFNEKESFIGCQEKDDLIKLKFGDENCCVPRTYDLIYDIEMDNEVIFQFSIVSGDRMNFEFISPLVKHQLEGYKLLLAGKLTIKYRSLKDMVIKNGLAPEDCMVELVHDTLFPAHDLSSYYWEVDNGLDGDRWQLLVFNAMTGKNLPDRYLGMSED